MKTVSSMHGDAIWPSLRLWTDANHEIVGRRDRYGNRYRYKGSISMTSDAGSKDRVYDIIFVESR
jgi:hypothetical protein